MYQRRSPRAPRYDYTSGWGYFITICTKDREHYFGEIEHGEMVLNELGKQTRECRNKIPHFHSHCDVHDFVCMPNHIHGILIIGESVGTHHIRPMNHMRPINTNGQMWSIGGQMWSVPTCASESLWSIIRGFKIGVTKYAKQHDIAFAWQWRYHDHIIRNEQDYQRIQYYIQTNPEHRWEDIFGKIL